MPVGSTQRPKGQYSRPAWSLNTVNTVTGKTHTGKNRNPHAEAARWPPALNTCAECIPEIRGLMKRNNTIPWATASKPLSDFCTVLQPTLSPLITIKASLSQMLKVTNHQSAKSVPSTLRCVTVLKRRLPHDRLSAGERFPRVPISVEEISTQSS